MMGFKSRKTDLTRRKPFGAAPNSSHHVTFVVIPGDVGRSRKFTVPKYLIWMASLLGFGFIATGGAFTCRYFELRDVEGELSRLRLEHESIRNEATALYSQLLDVQSNLNQVDTFSNQVREATKLEDGQSSDQSNDGKNERKPRRQSSSTTTKPFVKQLEKLAEASQKRFDLNIPASEGIGPISREDFNRHLSARKRPQNLAVPAKVRPTSLQFADVFSELENVKDQSSEQIDDLASLLTEVHQYRIRIDQTPTLAPVDGRFTSSFGFRQSPFSGKFRMHNGLDIAAPLGSPIRAAAAGVVLKVGRAADYGKYVKLQHAHEVVTVYAHAQRILVQKGDVVHKGQTIALVGMTGRTTGPHLHYEVRVNNRRVNPTKYLSFNKGE